MRTNLTELRANLYKMVDQLIVSGQPIELERHGHLLKIILADPPSKLSRLVDRKSVVHGDPDDFVHMNWSERWQQENGNL